MAELTGYTRTAIFYGRMATGITHRAHFLVSKLLYILLRVPQREVTNGSKRLYMRNKTSTSV